MQRPISKILILAGFSFAGALLFAFIEVAAPHAVQAQALPDRSLPFEVRLEPLEGTTDDNFLLQIEVTEADTGTIVPPEFPESERFAIRLEGQSQRLNIVNGVSSSSVQLNYRVYPSQSLSPGRYRLPDFELLIGAERYPVRGPEITIAARDEQPAADADVSFRQVVDTTKPYVGQQVVYRAKLVTSPKFIRGELDELEVPSVLRESLGSQNQRSRRFANKTLTMVSEVLIPTEVGRIEIPARGLTAHMRKPTRRRSIFDLDPFEPTIMQGVEKRRFVAEGIALDVRPLPPAPPEAGDYIPVGKLKATTSVNTRSLEVGESVSLTIDLYGRANLRPFLLPDPLEEVRGFKVYQDQPSLSTSPKGDQILYRKRFSIALVPTKPGSLQLPRYRIVYFDPFKSRYETLETDSIVVDVRGEAMPDAESETAPASEDPADVPVLEDGLRPQKEGAQLYSSYVALSPGSLRLMLLGIPLLYVLLYILQRRRSEQNDPARRARQESLNIAQSQLTVDSLSNDELWKVLVEFINRRVPEHQFSGDASALAEVLERSDVSTQNREAAAAFAARLERMRFSGHGGKPAQASDVEQLQELLPALYSETE